MTVPLRTGKNQLPTALTDRQTERQKNKLRQKEIALKAIGHCPTSFICAQN